jgi:peptidoglycan/LPS O-acetylase OafA/YrhL
MGLFKMEFVKQKIINSFQRTTYSTDLIREIDGLRFYAIITVVIFHLNSAYSRQIGLDQFGINEMGGGLEMGTIGWWIIRLDLGVKFFFAISGFVLALPFIKQYFFNGRVVILKEYILRRLTRLEPPFIITLFLFYLIHIFVLKTSAIELLPNFVAGLFYMNGFIFGVNSPINPVTWSLETEAQFYLLIPFVFYLIGGLRLKLFRLAILLAIFFGSIFFKSYFIQNEIVYLQGSILSFFSNFIAGILFAWLYLTNKEYFRVRSLIWDVVGVIVFFLQFYFYKPQINPVNNLFFNISIFLTFIAVFKGPIMNWIFTRKPIYLIGGMCYSIYLLHYPLFHLTIKFTSKVHLSYNYSINLFIQFLLNSIILLLISSVFFLLIEKPCMDKNWYNKLFNLIKSKIKKNGNFVNRL